MAFRLGSVAATLRLGASPVQRAYLGGQLVYSSGAGALPGQPTTVQTTQTTSTATLSWQPPLSDGGSPITGYRVGRDGTDSFGGGAWSTIDPPTARSREFLHLVNGQTYTLSVAAITVQGESAAVTKTVTIGAGAVTPTSAMPKQGVAPGYKILTRATADQNFELGKIQRVAAGKPCFIRLDSTPSNQAQMDTIMAKLPSYGLTPYIILFGSAQASQAIGTFPADQVTKWGSACNHYEICNEPDEPSLGGTWPVNVYADFVKACAIQIRGVDSTKRVIAGSLFNGSNELGTRDGTTPDAYVTALCQRAAGYFDFLSMHLYEDPLQRGGWNGWDRAFPNINGVDTFHKGFTVREILDAYGLSHVPIISTENGATTRDKTEQQIADIVARNFNAVRGDYGIKLPTHMVYTMMNDDVPGFGMLRDDLSERPAFGMFMSRAVPNDTVTASVPGVSSLSAT